MNAQTLPHATPHPALTPGSPEWARHMSASKIAAIAGHSPYESRFSLWHKMRGLLPWDDGRNLDEKNRGHYLEPALRQWFRDQNPHLTVERTGTWRNNDRPWQIATPDGLVHPTERGHEPAELIECKTSANDWEWGEPGTDEIPPGYYDQTMWALDTTGARTCHLAVLSSFMEFRYYRVDYDPAHALWLREQAREFMASLDGQPPSIDDHDATYRAVRQLHPDIDDVDVEIPHTLALAYAEAKAAKDAAEAAYRGAGAQIAQLLGTARVAKTPTGVTVAYRKAGRAGATPYLNPARGLTARLTTTERTAS